MLCRSVSNTISHLLLVFLGFFWSLMNFKLLSAFNLYSCMVSLYRPWRALCFFWLASYSHICIPDEYIRNLGLVCGWTVWGSLMKGTSHPATWLLDVAIIIFIFQWLSDQFFQDVANLPGGRFILHNPSLLTMVGNCALWLTTTLRGKNLYPCNRRLIGSYLPPDVI